MPASPTDILTTPARIGDILLALRADQVRRYQQLVEWSTRYIHDTLDQLHGDCATHCDLCDFAQTLDESSRLIIAERPVT